jgi:hypothetical protein
MFLSNPCCKCATCGGACSPGSSVTQIEVDIGGIGNGTCTDCADYNGLYILPAWVAISSSRCSACTPRLNPTYPDDPSDKGCNAWESIGPFEKYYIEEQVCVEIVGPQNQINVYFSIGSITDSDSKAQLNFQTTIIDDAGDLPIDCTTIDKTDLDIVDYVSSSFCDTSGATCNVRTM